MKRRERELIKLAFEELSREEAAQMDAQLNADPSAHAEAQLYRQMREELQRLKNIPEPQISTERLRDAILTTGLKQNRPSFGWSWVLAPSLAAIVLIAFVANRPSTSMLSPGNTASRQNEEAPVPLVDAVFSPIQTEMTSLSKASQGEVSFGESVEVAPVATSQPKVLQEAVFTHPQVRHSARLRSASRPSTTRTKDSMDALVAFNAEPAPVEESRSLDSNVLPPTSGAIDVPIEGSSLKQEAGDKILVVDGARDRQTGTATATEVGTNADVIVGG